jgi:cbb3-type cytochrome oxidase subunit 3/DNA-binding beta-propeller fold protein YncE
MEIPHRQNGKPLIVLFMGAVFFVAVVYFAFKFSRPNSFCDEAPYLYVTFHDEVPNIMKYSRNGCLLSRNVLIGGPEYAAADHVIELRAMKLGTYKDEPALYVADAYTGDSYLNVYGSCDADGNREFITTATSTVQNIGVNHIYGIAFDNKGNLFASSQHTDNVLRFYKDSFKPMPLPSLLRVADSRYFKNYDGTFIQFGAPVPHDRDEQGVRDIAHTPGFMWVANEDISGVAIIDEVTGLVEDIVPIDTPIGLHYQAENGLVFVSSKGENKQGMVYAVSVFTRQIVQTYKSKKMRHPTGMATHGTTLYIANQKLGQIVSFNIKSGRFLSRIVEHMPYNIEQLLISDC